MASDKDLESVQQARDLVDAAHEAQQRLVTFDQARIDRICEAMAAAGVAEAERLGQLAHEETGFGVAADKAVRTGSPPATSTSSSRGSARSASSGRPRRSSRSPRRAASSPGSSRRRTPRRRRSSSA
jgi:hypothetical protein